MNTVLIILAFVCLVVGAAAVFLPFPPGVPVAWLGLLLARIGGAAVSTGWLIGSAVVGIALMVLDYIVPIMATRHFGGSKWGTYGCTVGLLLAVLGLPFGPGGLVGIFFWPFMGALVGEWLKQREWRPALRAAWGAFLGMLAGTMVKIAYAVVLAVKVITAL